MTILTTLMSIILYGRKFRNVFLECNQWCALPGNLLAQAPVADWPEAEGKLQTHQIDRFSSDLELLNLLRDYFRSQILEMAICRAGVCPFWHA